MRGENGFHGRKQGGSQMLKHEGKGERKEDSSFAISSFPVFFFSGLEFWVVWIYLCWIGWVNLKVDNVYWPWQPKKGHFGPCELHLSFLVLVQVTNNKIFLKFYFSFTVCVTMGWMDLNVGVFDISKNVNQLIYMRFLDIKQQII